MKPNLFVLVAAALCGSLTLMGQAPQTPPPPPQQADTVRITLTGGGAQPKFAIAGFIPLTQDAETVAAAKTIGDVLYDDIDYEREYYMIGRDAIASIQKPTSIDQVPLNEWKTLNVDGLIVGTVRKTASGVLVQVKLIQVSTGKTAFGKEFSGSIANPRQYAHTIADEIFQNQLQLRGVARTKITFSSDRQRERSTGVADRDTKEIYFADYDGANVKRVTTTTTLNVAPMWSPDGQDIAFTRWRSSGPGGFGTFQDIVVAHIYRGTSDTPAKGSPDKQNYLCAWSPDGTKLAFTLSTGGNQEIYVMNAKDGSGLRRMTNHPDIDTSPTWSPTGNQIAWTSGRTGNAQIYIMNADGTGQRQLTHESNADRPTWSPAPFNEIAYAGQTGAGYDIKVYSFATGTATKITDSLGTNESPAFSPNGRHIAFVSTRNGKAQIFTIDRDGQHLRQITREGNNGYPNWSQ